MRSPRPQPKTPRMTSHNAPTMTTISHTSTNTNVRPKRRNVPDFSPGSSVRSRLMTRTHRGNHWPETKHTPPQLLMTVNPPLKFWTSPMRRPAPSRGHRPITGPRLWTLAPYSMLKPRWRVTNPPPKHTVILHKVPHRKRPNPRFQLVFAV